MGVMKHLSQVLTVRERNPDEKDVSDGPYFQEFSGYEKGKNFTVGNYWCYLQRPGLR
jgi:hypothetical protein